MILEYRIKNGRNYNVFISVFHMSIIYNRLIKINFKFVLGEKPHPCEICGKPFRVRSDMKRHLNTHTRDRHRTGSGDSLLHPTKVETSDTDILPPSSHTMPVDHQPAPGLSAVTEITVQSDGTGPESILPDESLGDNGTVAVLPSRHHHLAETAQQSGVADEVLQYTRDPLDSVRDTSNTLYVWPIYMT